jgi:hypothetical protein
MTASSLTPDDLDTVLANAHRRAVVHALDAAEKLLDGCPMSTGVRIYEAMPM